MAVSVAERDVSTGRQTKAERLEARISAQQKELFQHAADLSGRSLTDFVVNSAQEAAMETIERYEVVVLADRDSAAFVEALLNPAPPSGRLRRAAKRYKSLMG